VRENEQIHEIMARNIRRRMEELGLTITHVADFADINRAGLSRVLSLQEGITVDRLAKVAEVLEVPAWELLRDS
jgi:transcriptional regulator with XRE-family HTH domain